jgi:phospholipid transport system substrate-binding protein
LLAVAPGIVCGGVRTDQLRGTIDKALEALEDPSLNEPGRENDKVDRLRGIINKRFDWPEMAKRALGVHWRKRTPEERDEFVPLFTDLLERTYRERILRFSEEGVTVTYVKEIADDRYAQVETLVTTKNDEDFSVDYRLKKRDGRWLVYDVSAEGVSLVKNYRTQFNEILVGGSFEELLEKLRAKTK